MPTIVTRGAASAQAFGFGASSAAATYTYKWAFSCVGWGGSNTPKTFTAPSGVTSLKLEAIGRGGSTLGNGSANAGGGGGGSYAKSIITISSGATITYKIGTAGTCTWGSKSGGSPGSATCGVLALNGSANTGSTGGAGGLAVSSIGQVKYSGGTGGNAVISGRYGGGGGGAAGPCGSGGNGGQGGSCSVNGGGGGGGANNGTAGSNSTLTAGGAGGSSGGVGGAGGVGATALTSASSGTNGGGGGGGFCGKGPGYGTNYCLFGGSYGPGGGSGGKAAGSFASAYAFGGGAGGSYNGTTISCGGPTLLVASYDLATPPTNFMITLVNTAAAQPARIDVTVYGNYVAGVDSSNNVYSVGQIDSYTNIGIVKTSNTGSVSWSRKITTPSGASINLPVAKCDTSFNTYVAFSYYLSGTYNLIVAKYNSSGVIQWQRKYGSGNMAWNVGNISFDSSGNIWIAGVTSGNNYTVIHVIASTGSYVTQKYSNLISGYSASYSATIYPGESGYMYLQTVPLVTYICCCTTYTNSVPFLVKIDASSATSSSFTTMWARGFNSTNGLQASIYGAGVDSSNNVYWGFPSNNGLYISINKFNSSGTYQWGRKIDSLPLTNNISYYNNPVLGVNSSGSVYYSFSSGTSGSGSQSYFLVNLDSSGTFQYVAGVAPYQGATVLTSINSYGNYSAYLTTNNYFVGSQYSLTYSVAGFPTTAASGGQLATGNYGPLDLTVNTTYTYATVNDTAVQTGSISSWITVGDVSTAGTLTDSAASISAFAGTI